MASDIDQSARERTNPIYLTAKMAVYLMAVAGIPDAATIVERLDIDRDELFAGMDDPDTLLANALVVETKYRTMCRLIEATGYKTCVDLPCGYTPKALHLTKKGMRFFGLDLPIVAEEAGPIMLSLASLPEMMEFTGVDATNYKSLESALTKAQGPLCISTEGMMMYFTESEADEVVSNIRRLLETYGGCWITPDPEFMIQFYQTFRSVLSEGAIKKLSSSGRNARSASDVASLNNPLIVSPSNIEDSKKEALAFLANHGLKAELHELAHHMPELSVYAKLTDEQVKSFKEAMRNCFYWVVTLAESPHQTKSVPSEKSQPFSMDYTTDDQTFKVALSGRLDSISAPELLEVWEAEQEGRAITGAMVDCSDLTYISSAGLRVLMIMIKASPDGVMLTGVVPSVKSILDMSGIGEYLEIEEQ